MKRLPLIAAFLFSAIPGLTSPAGAQINQPILDSIKTMTFTHEAGVNTLAELNAIKLHIQNGEEPWASNYAHMAKSAFASLSYTPHPVPVVSEGINGADDVGGFDLVDDSNAAYTQALMWKLTGNNAYADKAVQILNAWSATLTDIQGVNCILLSAWSGIPSAQAAEILRNYPGWASADKTRYKTMLNTIYLPILNRRYGFGNRELAYCNALCSIGVFNDDRAAFYQGIHHWMSYFPCYVYMTADGAAPIKSDYWITEPTLDQYYAMHANIFPVQSNSWLYKAVVNYGDDKTWCTTKTITQQWAPVTLPPPANGFNNETVGRDLGHIESSISYVFSIAEMARVQGFDLYTGTKARMAAFLELNSSLRLGNPCPGGYTVNPANGLAGTYETGYNRLVNVLGLGLPNTLQLITSALRSAQNYQIFPASYPTFSIPSTLNAPKVWDQSGRWETLTHGNLNGASPGPAANLAISRPAVASSLYSTDTALYGTQNALDGDPLQSRWSSARTDNEWIYVDLGTIYNVTGVNLFWTTSYGKSYSIDVSNDAVNWTPIWSTTTGAGGIVKLTGLSGVGRYVRMHGTLRGSTYGYSLYEFQVLGSLSNYMSNSFEAYPANANISGQPVGTTTWTTGGTGTGGTATVSAAQAYSDGGAKSLYLCQTATGFRPRAAVNLIAGGFIPAALSTGSVSFAVREDPANSGGANFFTVNIGNMTFTRNANSSNINKLTFSITSGTSASLNLSGTTYTYTPGAWNLIEATFDNVGKSASVYINGGLAGTITGAGADFSVSSVTLGLYSSGLTSDKVYFDSLEVDP